MIKRSLATVLVTGLLVGCGARVNMRLAEGGFEKGAIRVEVSADPQLNRYQKNSHALLLCLYQLKEPDGFSQLAQERDGIRKLLECGRFDATVVSARQVVVQPGQELKDVRDRGEGARYLGVATGYYFLGRKKVTELSPLSPQRDDDPSGNLVRIDLGPHEIKSVRVE